MAKQTQEAIQNSVVDMTAEANVDTKQYETPRATVVFSDNPEVHICVTKAGDRKPVLMIGSKQVERGVMIDESVVRELQDVSSVGFYKVVSGIAETVTNPSPDQPAVDVSSFCDDQAAIIEAARRRVDAGTFTAGEAGAVYAVFEAYQRLQTA